MDKDMLSEYIRWPYSPICLYASCVSIQNFARYPFSPELNFSLSWFSFSTLVSSCSLASDVLLPLCPPPSPPTPTSELSHALILLSPAFTTFYSVFNARLTLLFFTQPRPAAGMASVQFTSAQCQTHSVYITTTSLPTWCLNWNATPKMTSLPGLTAV